MSARPSRTRTLGIILPVSPQSLSMAEECTAFDMVSYRSVIVGYYIAIVGAYRCGLSICYERAAFPEYGSIPVYGAYTMSRANEEVLTGSADLVVTPAPV